MPSAHDYNPSNEPDTCLWCGATLYHEQWFDWLTSIDENGDTRSRRINQRNRYARKGPYGDGFFCTMRCAQRFAIAAANNGYRLAPKQETK